MNFLFLNGCSPGKEEGRGGLNGYSSGKEGGERGGGGGGGEVPALDVNLEGI